MYIDNRKHTVVHTDCMSATEERDGVVSVYVENDTDNGCIFTLDGVKDNEREIYNIHTPTTDQLGVLVLICTPEVDSYYKTGLYHFYNKAGELARAYRLHIGDIFSMTETGFDHSDDISVGDIVYIKNGSALLTTEETSVPLGFIAKKEIIGGIEFYMVQIDSAVDAEEGSDSDQDSTDNHVGSMVVGTGVVG